MPVYVPPFAGRPTHCAYPRRDGQVELDYLAGYMPRWQSNIQVLTIRLSVNRITLPIEDGQRVMSVTTSLRRILTSCSTRANS